MSKRSEIAVIGAGLGGGVAALLLGQAGFDVKLYEQADSFSRLGAGIQLGPNVLKIMRKLGLESKVEAMGSKPESWISRNAQDGAILADIPLNRRRGVYDAAYVTLHRGDFHRLLIDALPADVIVYDRRLTGLSEQADGVSLQFADGATAEADIVIGADGVNSMVRELLHGPEAPLYTGYVGHRAIFPSAALKGSGFDFDECAKWWSEDRHMMVYYLDAKQQEMYYVTGVPEPDWPHSTSFVASSREEMREAFAGYHPVVQTIIEASTDITKWPLLTRPPLPVWSRGRVALLGDACHPMKPHMAQGAAMAVEDAAMIVRCLELTGTPQFQRAFELYRTHRLERASRVQAVSNSNTWLREQENPDWVYAYDVFKTDLLAASDALTR
jgi:6-hydroxynicotinate 3-monooxygenase